MSNGWCWCKNISYADDVVLLRPSVGSNRKLLKICKEFVVAHGHMYNTNKNGLF